MHLEYTPEEVRALLAEHEALEYASATDADIAEAADVLEGIEELVGKLDPAVRRQAAVVARLRGGMPPVRREPGPLPGEARSRDRGLCGGGLP